MGADKSKMKEVTIEVIYESNTRAFNSETPIIGSVKINADKMVPAYCISASIELRDNSLKIDHGDKG